MVRSNYPAHDLNMKIFLLEEVLFDSVDSADGERREIRLSDGFWANREKCLSAKNRIGKSLGDGWVLESTEFEIPMRRNQKYLYVLNYEYFTEDGTCFYYQFEPCTSRGECLAIKNERISEKKYQADPSRIFRRGKDGWFIERYEIVF